MIVYHGSRIIVDKPDTKHSRKRVDFGPGFYVTPIKEQAEGLCKRFLTIGQEAYVSRYIFDDAAFGAEGVRVLNFDSYSEEWLDFVINF